MPRRPKPLLTVYLTTTEINRPNHCSPASPLASGLYGSDLPRCGITGDDAHCAGAACTTTAAPP